MKSKVLVILFIILLFACKPKNSNNNIQINQQSDTDNFTDTIINSDEYKTPVHKIKKVMFDTILYFQSIERIFEDEFYLIFKNDSNTEVKFYFIPRFRKQIKYNFISESEGDFISNTQLEGKKFKISYSKKKQVTFDGETIDSRIIESIELLDSIFDENKDKLYIRMEIEAANLMDRLQSINWEEALRNDSSDILYEEDFRYEHVKCIQKVFIGMHDCSDDSVFRAYYSDRTIITGGTEPSLIWTLDFTIPTLNISKGEHKESILAKLGRPSYDFDSILVYPKYIPDAIVEIEGGNNYDDTVFLIFKNDKLIGIIATFYYLC
ncbi:MAG: hypothetical protein JXB49_37600 [Bacteroidales bacterium]|nr:hypothetical protein [Bacteroidales bacterium]